MKISTFNNRFDKTPKTIDLELGDLFDGLSARTSNNCTDKNSLPLWSPTTFKASRSQSNAIEISCLVFDMDDGIAPFDSWRYFSEFNVLAHTSFSHKPSFHKYRIIIPLAKPIPAKNWRLAHVAGLQLWAEKVGRGEPDIKAIKDSARMYYRYSIPQSDSGGACPMHPKNYHRIEGHVSGKFLDLDYSHIKEEINDRVKIDKSAPIAYNDLLNQTHVRSRIAHECGASISGNVARKIKCLSCGDRSVHFYIDLSGQANPQRFASCNHRNSCGWFGDLGKL